jgi:hypothetical protein
MFILENAKPLLDIFNTRGMACTFHSIVSMPDGNRLFPSLPLHPLQPCGPSVSLAAFHLHLSSIVPSLRVNLAKT